MSLSIRAARPGEASLVLQFVRELAEYEKLSHTVAATEAILNDVLFADQPRVFCEFAEWDGEVVGFAVWLLDYSTFTGRHGIYLEDLFVRPAHRGKGIGKALMIHLARDVCIVLARHVPEHAALPFDPDGVGVVRIAGLARECEPIACLHRIPRGITVVIGESGERGVLYDDTRRCVFCSAGGRGR